MCTWKVCCITALSILLGSVMTSTVATASCDSVRCVSKIGTLYPTGLPDGVVYIEPAEDSLAALNCTPKDGAYLTLHHSHKNYKELFSIASLAVLTNKIVNMRIEEGSEDCSIQYIMMNNYQ